jgi:hypothetical protein
MLKPPRGQAAFLETSGSTGGEAPRPGPPEENEWISVLEIRWKGGRFVLPPADPTGRTSVRVRRSIMVDLKLLTKLQY